MMTLDEAIKHCKEVVEELEKEAQEWHENQVRKCELIPFAEMDYTHENDCIECVREHKQLAEWMKELKQLREQTRWTPCSERLPKENEYVGDVCKYYLIQDEYGDMHVAHLSKVGWIPMDSLKAIGNEIIAWQELPQPYAESEDRRSKETTCENCIYANECIMYEPKMKRCKDYKESEEKRMNDTDIIVEVLSKFTEPYLAIGETNYDERAYNNLIKICNIHEFCYEAIRMNAELKGNEHSIVKAREEAIRYISESIDYMRDLLDDLRAESENKE